MWIIIGNEMICLEQKSLWAKGEGNVGYSQEEKMEIIRIYHFICFEAYVVIKRINKNIIAT